jgi:hypothetical protein
MQRDNYYVVSSAGVVPTQVSQHNTISPCLLLTANLGATSLAATWQPNSKRQIRSFIIVLTPFMPPSHGQHCSPATTQHNADGQQQQ